MDGSFLIVLTLGMHTAMMILPWIILGKVILNIQEQTFIFQYLNK